MCVDFAIHDTDSGNPHCHIMLTMRPLTSAAHGRRSPKRNMTLIENGERIRLPSGKYKARKVDLTGWNDKGNALLWRKAWADISNAYLERAGSPERIDHRSNAERGIDELPTVHMGVAACQMEKKGIATEKGELNRNIQKANRLIREIRAQIGKLKEWIGELFKARETAPEQPPAIPRPCKSADEVFKRSERKEPEVFAELAKAAHRRRTENRCKGGQLSFRAWHFHP